MRPGCRLVLVSAMFWPACSDSGRDRPEQAAAAATSPVDSTLAVPDPDPCDDGVFKKGWPIAEAWAVSSLTSCLGTSDAVSTSSGTPAIYSSCNPIPWTPAACNPMPWGAQYCNAGRWTVLCHADIECPSGMRCLSSGSSRGVGTLPADEQFGTCEKTCSSDADCVRCDLHCDVARGLCRLRPPSELGYPDAGSG